MEAFVEPFCLPVSILKGFWLRELLSKLKNCTILEETVSLKSALKEEQLPPMPKVVPFANENEVKAARSRMKA